MRMQSREVIMVGGLFDEVGLEVNRSELHDPQVHDARFVRRPLRDASPGPGRVLRRGMVERRGRGWIPLPGPGGAHPAGLLLTHHRIPLLRPSRGPPPHPPLAHTT